MADPIDPAPDDNLYRWQTLLQRSHEPVFLLNRRRQIVFVNRAWEQLTTIPAAQAINLSCKRTRNADPLAALAAALSPPTAVRDGQAGRLRRLLPVAGGARISVEIDFLPLLGDHGLLGIIGKLTARQPTTPTAPVPLPEKLHSLRESLVHRYRFDLLTAETPAMQRVVEQARLASQTRASVLLTGERGTGKQSLARTIHHQGMTRELPFVALDCAGLPSMAVTAVLFGPDGMAQRPGVGTVFLGHVSALPREVQAQLADWVAEPEPNRPRVIASLVGQMEQEIEQGRLLHELACSLATIAIPLPPLRDRLAELPLLIQAILDRANAERTRPIQTLSKEATEAIRAHAWPGNLRELRSVLESASAHSTTDRIDVTDLPSYFRARMQLEQTAGRAPLKPIPLKQLLEQVERRLIEMALRRAKGKKGRAARILAIWRPLLLRRMKKLGIPEE
jgi:transcriptional regulator with PAS, ATPase and Fis domain